MFTSPDALEAYQRAIAADSDFALCWWRMSESLWAEGEYAKSLEAARHAQRLANRLLPHDRLMLSAQLERLTGDIDHAEAHYRAALDQYPEDFDAWYGLGDALSAYGAFRGRDIEEGRGPLERALMLRPDYGGALYDLAALCAIAGDTSAYIRYATRLQSVDHEFFDGAFGDLSLATARGDTAAWRRALVDLLAKGHSGSVPDVVSGLIVPGYLDHAHVALTALCASDQPSAVHDAAWTQRMVLAAVEGQWREVRACSERVSPAHRIETDTNLAILGLAVFPERPAADLRAIRSRVEGWTAPALARAYSDTTTPFSRTNGPPAGIRAYLLGMIDARLDQRESAKRFVAELEHRDAESWSAPWTRYHAIGIRATLESRAGHPDRALALLASVPTPSGESGRQQLRSYSVERMLRAELLLTLHRDDEALGWYSSLGTFLTLDLVNRGPAMYRRGQILQAQGRDADAARAFTNFVRLWRECDQDLVPIRTDAERRLLQLRKLRS